jgi:hypothetical protein
MQFSKLIIYTFINTILATGRDDSISQNDDRLSPISSVDDKGNHQNDDKGNHQNDDKGNHQNDDSLPKISSTPSSYPNDDSSSNSSLNSSYINYLGLLCIPIIMLL